MQTFIHASLMDFINNNMGNTFQISVHQQSPQQDSSGAEKKACIPSSHAFQSNFVANLKKASIVMIDKIQEKIIKFCKKF